MPVNSFLHTFAFQACAQFFLAVSLPSWVVSSSGSPPNFAHHSHFSCSGAGNVHLVLDRSAYGNVRQKVTLCCAGGSHAFGSILGKGWTHTISWPAIHIHCLLFKAPKWSFTYRSDIFYLCGEGVAQKQFYKILMYLISVLHFCLSFHTFSEKSIFGQ